MTAEQQLIELRKIADQPKPPSLRKALEQIAERNAVHDMYARLRAGIEARRAAIRMREMDGATEWIS